MESTIILSQINLQELADLLSSRIKGDLIKSIPPPTQISKNELPIGFDKAMEILCMKERTLRAKIATNEIPYYQRARQLYFFESELIEYIKTGKRKTVSEIQEEAQAYIKITYFLTIKN